MLYWMEPYRCDRQVNGEIGGKGFRLVGGREGRPYHPDRYCVHADNRFPVRGANLCSLPDALQSDGCGSAENSHQFRFSFHKPM